MRSTCRAFCLGRRCSSPALTDCPARPPPRGWRSRSTSAGRRFRATATRLFGDLERPVIRVALPDAPGAKILLSRLASDWGAIGITGRAGEPGKPADLSLIDAVAPSTSPAWFLRTFRCGTSPVCDPEADELLGRARGGDRRRSATACSPRPRSGWTNSSCSSRLRLRSAGRSFRPSAKLRNQPLRAAHSDVASPAARPGACGLTDRRRRHCPVSAPTPHPFGSASKRSRRSWSGCSSSPAPIAPSAST